MNNTIQSLQELYVKLGGSLTDTYDTIASGIPVSDYTIIPDMIEALSQVASSGSGLPEITDEDNDKILTVEAGQWAVKYPAVPAEMPRVFTFEHEPGDAPGDEWRNVNNNSFFEIINALLSGAPVMVNLITRNSLGTITNIDVFSGLSYSNTLGDDPTTFSDARLYETKPQYGGAVGNIALTIYSLDSEGTGIQVLTTY